MLGGKDYRELRGIQPGGHIDSREGGNCGWSLRTSRGGVVWKGVGGVAGGNRGLGEQPAAGSAGGEKSLGRSGEWHADGEQLVLLTLAFPWQFSGLFDLCPSMLLWSSPHPWGAGDIGVRDGQFSVKKADCRCADEESKHGARTVEVTCLPSQC